MNPSRPPDLSERAPADWLEAANHHATVAQLLTTVVHQVNNALQTIGGHAELLRTEPGVGVATIRRAELIAGVTSRVAELLADVQTLARPRREAADVDLRGVAEQALALRRYGLGRAKIEVALSGDQRAIVRAEPQALLQVVLNLILNAEQALACGSGGRIDMVVSCEADGVLLEVTDSGSGPAAPPGGRGSESRRLGIGLPVADAIVARFGGTLTVEAAQPMGTRVRVLLPAVWAGRSQP